MAHGGNKLHTALILIDCQKAFLSGGWARYFGLDQVSPIKSAFANTLDLLRSKEKLSGCDILCTKCYTEGDEADFVDELLPFLRDTPCVWKPNTNITQNPRFHDWFKDRLGAGVRTVVIGGCTTTSCVRVSSQAIRKLYPQGDLRVVVDLSLCGARRDNLLPNADQDPNLVRIYGRDRCKGLSPVDLAKTQMKASGVDVVDSFDWEYHQRSMQ